MNARGTSLMKWSLVGPTLAFLLALNLFPLVYNIVLSFTNAELTDETSKWVGSANYARVFARPEYAAALRTTAVFVVAAVSIELVVGFAVALALHRRFPGKTVVLVLLLIPMMLPPAVMGLFFNHLLDGQRGLVNQLLALAGLPGPQWLTNPDLKLLTLVLVDVWMWTPFMMLISLAGLNAIPAYLYEAAEIDRASRWTVFRRITLPLCAPLLVLAVLLRTTDALKQFDLVMAITGPNDRATQMLSPLLYQEIFSNQKVGLGSAYACVVLVVVIALATVFTRYIGRLQAAAGKGAA